MGRPRARTAGQLLSSAIAVLLAASGVMVAPVANLVPTQPALAAASFVDPFFREDVIFSGLNHPTSVRFATDGRAFVAEKGGRIKAYDSITDTTPTTTVDFSDEVMDYWDRGLLGLAIDPAFLTGRPYLYVLYVWGGLPGETPARWGDSCPAAPTGPGSTTDGCPASSKIERLTIDPATNLLTARTPLIWDFCQQFPSHSGGGMAIGPDGELYVATGDGASFNGVDYGQRGGTIPNPADPFVPVNPCDDPVTLTSPAGSAPTVNVTTAEGGQLRSQDIRTTADPVGLDGTLMRIDPDTGAPSAGNPITSGSANAKRIVAHGFRNPYRMTFRPGTTDLYVGHVGNQTWEAINRIAVPSSATPTTLPNAGWPCYEGPEKPAAFLNLGTAMCDSLYAAGSAAWAAPFYSYSHVSSRSPTGPCFNPVDGRDGGSPTGLAFYQGPGAGTASYPAKYVGGLFFVDYDRDCLAYFPATANGVPDATKMAVVATGIASPVDLLAGPGGNLFYVDHEGGRVMRVRYVLAPVARATVTPDAARAPVTVQLSATTSTDPDPSASLIAYRWDLDDDGQYDDATGATYDWSITTPDVYPVGLEVESSNGLKDTASITVDATNTPPEPVIENPTASFTWAVGDEIEVGGTATDAEDGDLTGTALRWDVVMLHCPADCHEHLVESFTGETGTFDAPDHPYPSHLEVRLTATDSNGAKRTASVEIEPRTKTVSVTSSPTGVPISLGGDPVTSPSTTTVLENGEMIVTPPLTTTIGGTRHRFWAWADATARTRNLIVDNDLALAATYLPDRADTCATAPASSSRTWLTERPNGNDDVDWFGFSLGEGRRVLVTLGDLPVDARLDLYSSCSTRLASSDEDGTRFEEITRRLGKGTYRVKVSFPGGGRSQTSYVLRFQPLVDGMVVKSSRTTSGPTGGSVRIVGEVLNNTGATRGRPTVTATFRSAGGAVVKTLSAKAFARRIGDGGVTPFVLAGTVPTYASVSFAVSAGSPPSSRSLDLTSLTRTSNGNGTITEKGTVRNTGSVTAREVAAARTWYGKRGEVLDRGSAFVSPSTLAPGRSGTFTILRPVLPTVQATRTAFRAS